MAGWSYEKAMEYLNSRTNYEKKWPTYGPVTFSLERMKRLNALLGDPQDRYPSIHITGTKGKGSTAAMVASILQAGGLKAGLYTSPHLVNIEERIRVNGQDIPKERLAASIEHVSRSVEFIRGIAPPPHPTFFEIFTTAGFCWFADEKVDWAVVEVGLGGRLDSTNIILPEAAVVTRVGLDHMNILGDTVAEIATEKAGIIKKGIPVVMGPQEKQAERVVRGRAGSLEAPVWGVGREIEVGPVERRGEQRGYRFPVKTPFAEHAALEIPLVGTHQVENAAVAVGVIDVLRSRGKLALGEEAIAEGLRKVEAPARVEVMGTSPLVVVDGAHNPLAMGALATAVRENFTYKRLVLLFAMATDKDIPGSLDVVLPLADEVFFTVTNSPRAAKPQILRRIAIACVEKGVRHLLPVGPARHGDAVASPEGAPSTSLRALSESSSRNACASRSGSVPDPFFHCEADQTAAFRKALAATGPGEMLLITGSLYLAGDLRPVILSVLGAGAGK